MQNKEINYTFKVLSAFGIIFIVAGHCNNMGLSLVYEWFPPYSFHLALFVFISGYFYSESNENNVIKYIIKKIKNLILPTFIWNIVYGVIANYLKNYGFTIGGELNLQNIFFYPLVHGHQFMFNLSSWFIVPLFFAEIFNVCFRKILSIGGMKNDWFFFCVYLGLGIIGIQLSGATYIFEYKLFFTRIMFFLPCFSFGRMYRVFFEKRDNLRNSYYFAIIFLVDLIIITIYGYTGYTVASCNDFIHGPILPYISALLGIAFWLRVAKIWGFTLKESKIVMLIANNTYSIMMHHLMGFMILKFIFFSISHFTTYYQDFDILKFQSDIFYYYFPKGIGQFALVYVIVGICFSLLIKGICSYFNSYIKILYTYLGEYRIKNISNRKR